MKSDEKRTLQTRQINDLQMEATTLLAQGNQLTIETPLQAEAAKSLADLCGKLKKRFIEIFKDDKKRAKDALDAVTAEISSYTDPLDAVVENVKNALKSYINSKPQTESIVEYAPLPKGCKEDWICEVVDPVLVPAYLNGVEIRQIHQPNLNQLVKMGVREIPGCVIKKSANVRLS